MGMSPPSAPQRRHETKTMKGTRGRMRSAAKKTAGRMRRINKRVRRPGAGGRGVLPRGDQRFRIMPAVMPPSYGRKKGMLKGGRRRGGIGSTIRKIGRSKYVKKLTRPWKKALLEQNKRLASDFAANSQPTMK